MGKINIIEINGKRYDVNSGATVGHPVRTPSAKPKTITVVTKLEPAQHKASDHAKPVKSAPQPRTHTGRQRTNNSPRHTTQHSKTLMRRAVKKPAPSLKRRIKVQGHTGTLVEQPSSQIVEKISISSFDPKRLQRASHVKKSNLIKHFNPNQPVYAVPVTVTKTVVEPVSLPVADQPTAPTPDFLELAIQNATSHLEPAPKKPRKRRLHLTRRHQHAKA